MFFLFKNQCFYQLWGRVWYRSKERWWVPIGHPYNFSSIFTRFRDILIWLSLRRAKEQARSIRFENFQIGQSLSKQIESDGRFEFESNLEASQVRKVVRFFREVMAPTLAKSCPKSANFHSKEWARFACERARKRLVSRLRVYLQQKCQKF